ncbi:hypothetical protein CCP3SC15_940012 [Gammaproteobacteria bacterium]
MGGLEVFAQLHERPAWIYRHVGGLEGVYVGGGHGTRIYRHVGGLEAPDRNMVIS